MAIHLNPPTEFGYSLNGLQTYLSVGNIELCCNKETFWNAMAYFLQRKNKRFRASQKRRIK